jgi:serine/threonine-protein kinase HipA
VVTTSAYDIANARGETMADRTMALKMNGTKNYPGRADLLAFGRLCSVRNPDIVIERIADAMQTALQTYGSRGEPKFLQRMKREWDAGRTSVERTRFR